jgi:hypothetical protein
MSRHHRQSVADKLKAQINKDAQRAVLQKDIREWQGRADKTDFDDEGGTKYDEVALKALVDEARTLLLRCSLSL